MNLYKILMILLCRMTTLNMMLEDARMNNNMQCGLVFLILFKLDDLSQSKPSKKIPIFLLSSSSIYDAIQNQDSAVMHAYSFLSIISFMLIIAFIFILLI